VFVIPQMSFKLSPQPTQSMPNSLPPTWSFRDTKRSEKQDRVIWNWLAAPVQGKKMKTAPLTKKMTETETDCELGSAALTGKMQGCHFFM